MRTKNPYKINIVSSTSRQNYYRRLATPLHQNYHRCSATPPRQNYHRHSITPPRHHILLHVKLIETIKTLKVAVIDQFLQTKVLVLITEISFLKSTMESLINEVNKLKSDKATTSNNPSEYVDVNDTETTGVMGTTGLFCPMDNMGLCDLDANETTDTPCDNTNSAIATSTVNPSNKK
ncbi:15099_t:CDS:2, partial [Gigaspora rosea]